MDALKTIALTKLVPEKDEKAARPLVKPGRHLIDFTVRVQGALDVGEDFDQAQTARAMSLEGVATALYFAGATREKGIEALVRVALGDKTEADEKRKEFVRTIVEDIKDRFAALPKKPAKGQVRSALVVTEIGARETVIGVTEKANV